MKRKLAVMAAFALASSATWAGFYQPAPVIVDLDNQFAQGDMTTAANTNTDVELIGCGTRTLDIGGGAVFRFGFCQATDSDGNNAVCRTQNPALLDAMNAINDRSFLTFSWSDDGNGNLTCTRIGSSTQSFYLDKIKPSSNNNGKND